jgi:hypothetical protein
MLVQNIPHKLRDRSSQCLFLRAVILLAEGKVRRWTAYLADACLSAHAPPLLMCEVRRGWPSAHSQCWVKARGP